MRKQGAVGWVCLVIGLAATGATARAQSEPHGEEASDDARANVELSIGVLPTLLAAVGSPGVGSLGGLGSGLVFHPALDVGFALDRSTLLVVGLSGSYTQLANTSAYSVSVPLSVLWYLEPPRVGHVMPMLRVGGWLGLAHADEPASIAIESYTGGLLARGGITWLVARSLAVRGEVGVRAGASYSGSNGQAAYSGSIGLDASIALVLRV
jgi:hypothetical protein